MPAGLFLGGGYEGVEHQFMNGSPAIQSANGGAMKFTTTHWSVVLEAQGQSPAAQEALEKLCRIYLAPRRHPTPPPRPSPPRSARAGSIIPDEYFTRR